MKKKRKGLKIFLIILGIIIAFIVFICLVVKSFLSNIDDISDSELEGTFNSHVVKKENVSTYVRGTGTITSFNIKTLDVYPGITIKEKYVNDGDTVKAKQKIMKTSVGGYIENITSPIAGMYFEVETDEGITYQIYDLKNIGIEFYVSENNVVSLKKGQKATVKITALNKEVEGKVTYVSKLPTYGKFKVKVTLPYTNDLRFGYGASVKILVAEKKDAIVIPYAALLMDENNEYYVVKKEHSSEYFDSYFWDEELPEDIKTYVEIGTITNNEVEILKGLNENDVVLELVW